MANSKEVNDMWRRTDVEDGHGQLDVTKVTGTLKHLFTASTTSELGVVQALFAWALPLFVHGLWIFNVTHAHVLDLFRREETKLHLLDGLQRGAGIWKRVNIHGGGIW